MEIPLYFEMLDNNNNNNNNSRNSNWNDRINKLFQSLMNKIGKKRIEIILMDREFIGNKWLLCADGSTFKNRRVEKFFD